MYTTFIHSSSKRKSSLKLVLVGSYRYNAFGETIVCTRDNIGRIDKQCLA